MLKAEGKCRRSQHTPRYNMRHTVQGHPNITPINTHTYMTQRVLNTHTATHESTRKEEEETAVTRRAHKVCEDVALKGVKSIPRLPAISEALSPQHSNPDASTL